jgi:hypothetical protein
MPRKLRPIAVPLDTPRNVIVREVEEKLLRFLADASRSSFPDGGETVTQPHATMTREITGMASRQEAIYAIKGDGRLQVNEAAAVCFIGAQETILLRLIHRTGQSTWVRYEFAFCTQERGRVATRWVNAKEYYAARPRPEEIDPDRLKSSANELIAALRGGQRPLRPESAQLTGDEVQLQIKSLRGVQFEFGANAARLGVGSYKAVCFQAGDACKLRVFRRAHDGWMYQTFTLKIGRKRPAADRRARGAAPITYEWKD